jgi:antirestriction protein ArdC
MWLLGYEGLTREDIAKRFNSTPEDVATAQSRYRRKYESVPSFIEEREELASLREKIAYDLLRFADGDKEQEDMAVRMLSDRYNEFGNSPGSYQNRSRAGLSSGTALAERSKVEIGDMLQAGGEDWGSVERLDKRNIWIKPLEWSDGTPNTSGRLFSIPRKLEEISVFKKPNRNSSNNLVQRDGTPTNRLNRRTQLPINVSRALSSGARSTYVPPMNDLIKEKIRTRFIDSKIKPKPMTQNLEHSPGGEWLLDGAKIRSLFVDENGKAIPDSQIAKTLNISVKELENITAEGNGVSELDIRKITEAIFLGFTEGKVNREVIRSEELSGLSDRDRGLARELFQVSDIGLEGSEESSRVAKRIGILDYPDVVGSQIWGFGYSPYWIDSTEETTITSIGKTSRDSDRAQDSFRALLEDGEVLRSVYPSPEPFGYEDDLSDVVINTEAAVKAPSANAGELVPQGMVLDRSNFPMSKLLQALGADPDNNLDIAQKILDTGVNISPQVINLWRRDGVPSQYIGHLVDRGVINSAAEVFGPEVGEFDRMSQTGEVYERIKALVEKTGVGLAHNIVGESKASDMNGTISRWKERKQKAKAASPKAPLRLSGKESRISDSRKKEMVDRYNVVAKKKGMPSVTVDEVFGNPSAGLSSGAKRFTNVDKNANRKMTARIDVKYPSLPKAYSKVSDIPTPARLDGAPLSSGRRDELYQTLTKSVIEQMEESIANGTRWSPPWRMGGMTPQNGTTKARYRGINTLMLSIAQQEGGYEKPIWASFDQWKSKGGSVKKGEKGTPIIFYSRVGREVEDRNNPGELKTESRGILRESYVFNLDQVEGIDRSIYDPEDALPEEMRRTDVDDISKALNIDLSHSGDRAYFSPLQDKIVIPPFSEFSSPEGYYGTLLHEIVHWTGHSSRLDRPNMGSPKVESEYAFEELIAELGTAYLMSILDITVEPREDHAQYLAFWVQKLKGEPDGLMRAATAAQKAVDYIIENVPALKEAQDKSDAIANEIRQEAKERADAVKASRPSSKKRSATTRRPTTGKKK